MGEADTASFWGQTRGLTWPFWVANIMETVERLAYYGVRVVIPIYIAQADEIGGLHFSQSDKGFIFLWWAGAVDPAGALGRLCRPLRLQKADRGGHRHQKPGLPDDGHPAQLLAVLRRLPAAGRGHRGLQAARVGHLCQDPDGQDLRGGLGFFLYDYQHRRLSGAAAGAFSLRLLLAHGLLRLCPAGQSESAVAAHLPGGQSRVR